MKALIQNFLTAEIIRNLLLPFFSEITIRNEKIGLKQQLLDDSVYICENISEAEKQFFKRHNKKYVLLDDLNSYIPSYELSKPQKSIWDIIFVFDHSDSLRESVVNLIQLDKNIKIGTFGDKKYDWVGHNNIDGLPYISQSKFTAVPRGHPKKNKYISYIISCGGMPLVIPDDATEKQIKDIYDNYADLRDKLFIITEIRTDYENDCFLKYFTNKWSSNDSFNYK